MRFAFYTLGCKANQFDTQALEQLVCERGHTIVPFSDKADIYVINTCTVTAESDRKSRQMVRSARPACTRSGNWYLWLFFAGVAGGASSLGADIVFGTRDRLQFLALLEKPRLPQHSRSRHAVQTRRGI